MSQLVSDDATQVKEMQCDFQHNNSFSFNKYELAVRDLMASASASASAPGLFLVKVDSETAHEDETLVKRISMQDLTPTSSKVRTLNLSLPNARRVSAQV